MLQGASEVSIRTTVKKRARRTVRKATPSCRKSARPTSAAATIRQIGHNWAQNWNTGDLEKLVAAYAPDAVCLPPHHEAVHGRDSIRDYLRVPRSHDVSDLAFDVTYIKQSGDVAWDVGTYRMSMPQSLKPSRGAPFGSCQRFSLLGFAVYRHSSRFPSASRPPLNTVEPAPPQMFDNRRAQA